MTRKLRVPSGLGSVGRVIAALILVIAMVAVARTGLGQSSGKQRFLHSRQAGDKETHTSTSRNRETQPPSRMVSSQSTIDFLPLVIYSSGGPFASSVAIADVNGDRKPDLLVAGGSVSVLLGNGDGSFLSAVTYDSGGGGSAEAIAVADVNGDGKPDLLVVNEQSSTVGVLIGNGDGTFQPVVTYGSGGATPLSIAVADVNDDHHPDLLVANLCANSDNCSIGGSVGVLLGNGDGTFRTAVPYNSGDNLADGIAVADVNNDGIPDLAVANNGGLIGTVGVLLGRGDGTFRQAVTYSSEGFGPTSVAVADVNKDGKADLLVANCEAKGATGCLDESLNGTVGVLLGNGDGTFASAVVYDSGGSGAMSVAITDANGDGKLDLVVADECDPGCFFGGVVGVLRGKSRGLFNLVTGFELVNASANSVAAGDLNGDGKPDLAVATNDATGQGAVGVLLNNTDIAPRFTKTVAATSGSPSLVGQAVTFTATVSSTHGDIPDGELVNFSDGMTALASVALSGGTATYTTSSLSAKAHNIKATYTGDPTFRPSAGAITQVVEKYATTTTLHSSLNPSLFGQSVTFTAHVKSSGPAPTGKVKFFDESLAIGSTTLSNGTAKLTKSTLQVGTHTITAEYLGDTISDKSTSPVVNQVVQ